MISSRTHMSATRHTRCPTQLVGTIREDLPSGSVPAAVGHGDAPHARLGSRSPQRATRASPVFPTTAFPPPHIPYGPQHASVSPCAILHPLDPRPSRPHPTPVARVPPTSTARPLHTSIGLPSPPTSWPAPPPHIDAHASLCAPRRQQDGTDGQRCCGCVSSTARARVHLCARLRSHSLDL